MKLLRKPSPFHLLTNPSVINWFIFGQVVVIYYITSHEEKNASALCDPVRQAEILWRYMVLPSAKLVILTELFSVLKKSEF